MKRVDITKQDDGFKFEVRENYVDEVLHEQSGFDSLQEAVEAAEALDLGDDFFLVANDSKEAGESAVTSLAREENVRTASYGEKTEDGDNDDLTPTSHIETVG